METVRRSQRVGRSKPIIEASVESTPAVEQKITARKALVDLTNTCSVKPYGSSRSRVAKKDGDVNEASNHSILKPAIDTELPSNAKMGRKVINSRGITSLSFKNISAVATAKDSTVKASRARKTKAVVGNKVESTPILKEVAKTAAVVATPKESVSKVIRGRKAEESAPVVGSKVLPIPISDDVSNITSAVGTSKDPVVKVVRGRKAKEQVQSESTIVSDRTSVVSQDISVTSGAKSRRKVVAQVESPTVIAGDNTGAGKEKVVSNQHRSNNFLEQGKRFKTSRSSKGSVEKITGSELKMALMRPKRAIRSKKGVEDVTSPEFSSGKNATLPTKTGMDNSVSVDIADGRRALPHLDNDNAVASGDSDRAVESIKMLKESSSDVDMSSSNGGLVTPSCHIQLEAIERRKKDTPKSDQEHMKGGEDNYSRRKAYLQTSGENPKPVLKQGIKKGTGRVQTSKMVTEKGTSKEVFCSSASNQKKCKTGGQRSSGYGQSTELFSEALKNAPVQPTVRRNLARGARKPVNYAEEDDNFGSIKVPTVLPGTSTTHIDPSSTVVGARALQQTTRRGRKKIAGASIAPTPSCTEEPLFDRSKELVNNGIEIPSTIDSSLEQEYERFKMEKPSCTEEPLIDSSKELVDCGIEIPSTIDSSLEQEYERFKMEKLACEIAAKKSRPTAWVEPIALTLSQPADLVTREEPFLCIDQTFEVVINSEEVAQSPARKFIRATRSPKAVVRANSPELQTVQVLEQVVPIIQVEIPSLSGEPGVGLSSQTPPVLQRGQKRGRKENNVHTSTVHASEPERLMKDADVDARPSDIIPPPDETANGREFNGAHEHDEQVDTDKEDGMIAKDDDPDRAVFEHEDQVCVDVAGKECNDPLFKPFASFDDADIVKKLKDCCKALGKPSPLQAHALPFLLAGRDLVAISESHAGHVHAYGVPSLQHALKNKKRYVRKLPSPICLVLADSSDVAQQITDSLEDTYGSLRVKIGMAVEDPQNVPRMESVRPGVSILVTTPSCLEKMLQDGSCSLALVSFIVLDGADCMLNNGCEASLRVILDQASTCQQIGVFSSTLVPEIEQLVQTVLPNSDIVKITVSKAVDTQEQLPLEQGVDQVVEVLEESRRDTRLIALLRTFQKGQKNRVLVYVLYKEEALHVEGLLHQRGWKVASVHGGIFEADRNKAVVSFQKGASSVLVATDVAARGLAIPNVDYVINYSFPYTLCDYARRLGQTGTTGRRGIMHTFFLLSNQGRAKELVEVLREAAQNVPEELLLLTSPAKKKPRTEY